MFHKEQHKITTPLDTPKAERITTPQPPPPPSPIPPSLCNIKEMAESALSRLREVSRGKVHQKLDRGECDFLRQTWDGEGGSAQVRSTSFLFFFLSFCVLHYPLSLNCRQCSIGFQIFKDFSLVSSSFSYFVCLFCFERKIRSLYLRTSFYSTFGGEYLFGKECYFIQNGTL